MSIDVPTELLTASSGSVGDLVFSRNQHGPYTRSRASPLQPNTSRQIVVQNALSDCVTAWRTALTAAERQAWDAFALAVRTRTALGRSTNAGGLGMYVRANVPRLQAAEVTLPRVDAAPTLLTSAPFTPITRVILNIVDDTIHPFFDESDPWVTQTGAAMLFYASPAQPLTRNFWAAPYRFAGPLLGSDPRNTSPGTVPLPFPAGSGQRVFVRGRLTLSDARTSTPFRLPADIVAQNPPRPLTAQIFNPGGVGAFVVVTFDDFIRRELHSRFNWFVRFNGLGYAAASAVTHDSTVRVNLRGPTLDVGADVCVYSPPPSDVNGLLTGIAVLPFTIPVAL